MAADKFLNLTAVQAFKTWATGLFSTKTELQTLDDKVDDIIAEGGEPNVIESISINGTQQTVTNKNVNLPIPTVTYGGDDEKLTIATPDGHTISAMDADAIDGRIEAAKPKKLSELTNDGDGTTGSKFATESYVQQNGGKINSISVNGTAQTIDANKNVDLTVPTKVSDLTNDSGYQTASDVQSAIASGVASAVKIKGSVATYADLPATGNQNGDMYDTLDTGKNYVWIEEGGSGRWDDYAGAMDMSAYWTSTPNQTNTLEAATVAEINAILNA